MSPAIAMSDSRKFLSDAAAADAEPDPSPLYEVVVDQSKGQRDRVIGVGRPRGPVVGPFQQLSAGRRHI